MLGPRYCQQWPGRGLEVQSSNKQSSAACSLHTHAAISQSNTPTCRVAGEQAFMTSALMTDEKQKQINKTAPFLNTEWSKDLI